MQLMPATAQRFSVSNPLDIEQNIRAGAEYLSYVASYSTETCALLWQRMPREKEGFCGAGWPIPLKHWLMFSGVRQVHLAKRDGQTAGRREMMLEDSKVAAALLALAIPTALAASSQEKLQPLIVKRSAIRGRVMVLNLGLRFATAIRTSEPVSSVVAGDPTLFKVEHSEKEPRLAFVKPLSVEPAQSNLLISTVGGHSVSLLVRTGHTRADTLSNAGPARPVHFLLELNPAPGFVIDEAEETSMLIEQTVPLARAVGSHRRVRGAAGSESPRRNRETKVAGVAVTGLRHQRQTRNECTDFSASKNRRRAGGRPVAGPSGRNTPIGSVAVAHHNCCGCTCRGDGGVQLRTGWHDHCSSSLKGIRENRAGQP
jgi:hypothetical protein